MSNPSNPFCHFFVTFIAAISHIQPELRFFQTHSQLFLSPPGLLLANKWPPMFLTRPPFYCHRRRTRFNLCILLLLIIGGVKVELTTDLVFSILNVWFTDDDGPWLPSTTPMIRSDRMHRLNQVQQRQWNGGPVRIMNGHLFAKRPGDAGKGWE